MHVYFGNRATPYALGHYWSWYGFTGFRFYGVIVRSVFIGWFVADKSASTDGKNVDVHLDPPTR